MPGGATRYRQWLTQQLRKTSISVLEFLGREDKDATQIVRHISQGNERRIVVGGSGRFANLEHPLRDCFNTFAERAFIETLHEFKPDLVHFHDLKVLPGSLVEIANAHEAKVVVSIHDYWFLCPERHLLTPSHQQCPGSLMGKNCYYICARGSKRTLWERARSRFRYIMPASIFSRAKQRYYNRPYRPRRSDTYASEHNVKLEEFAHYRFRQQYLRELLNTRVDAIIAVSNKVKEIFVREGIAASKIEIIHVGTGAARFWQQTNPKDNVQPPICFGYVGPVRPWKGVHLLLESLYYLNTEVPYEVEIWGAGDESYMTQLRHMAQKYPVEFKGRYEWSNLPRIYERLHFAVATPIWHDNGPQIVLEALSCRTPVVATEAGGIVDFIQDGTNGLLVEMNDSRKLAKAIASLLERPRLISSMSKQITRPRDMKQHLECIIQLYEGILET